MAGNSDLGLLFEITADPSAATAAVEGAASEINAALSRIQGQAADSSSAVSEGAHEMARAHGEAREAIRGTGELIGVTMPRYVANYLSSLGGVQSAMSAAFAGIAVLGLVEVYERLTEKVGGLEADLHGFSEASIKAWSETCAAIIGSENELLSYDEKLREIAQIGLSGLPLATEKQRENAEAIKETTAALDKETKARDEAQEKVNSFGTGMGNLFRSTEQYTRELGAANDALKQHGDQMQKLQNDILDLQLAQLRLNRETGAEGTKAQDEAAKKQEEAARRGAELAKRNSEVILRSLMQQNQEMAKVVAESYGSMERAGSNYAAHLKSWMTEEKQDQQQFIELLQLGAEYDKRFSQQLVEDMRDVIEWERTHIKTMQEEQKEAGDLQKKQRDHMSDLADEYREQIGLTHTLASALDSIGEIYGKNSALKIASLAAEAAVEVVMNTGAGLSALGDGDYWAAANYFASAAEYGIAAGAQAAGAGGGGGGGTRTGGGGGEVGSGASAAGSPVLAGGSRPSGAAAPVSVVLLHNDPSAAAIVTQVINNGIRTQGLQMQATHDGNGNRIGS